MEVAGQGVEMHKTRWRWVWGRPSMPTANLPTESIRSDLSAGHDVVPEGALMAADAAPDSNSVCCAVDQSSDCN